MDIGNDPFPHSLSGPDSPQIFDADMTGSMQNGDLEFFSSALPQDSPGRFFGDDTLAISPYQSPLSLKQQVVQEKPSATTNRTNFSASPDSSLQDSSSDSSRRYKRKTSSKSSHEGLTGQDVTMTDDVRPSVWKTDDMQLPRRDLMFDFSGSVLPPHQDYNFSNRAMENDFDFDSAASSPSPHMKSHTPAYTGPRHIAIPYRASPKSAVCLVSNEKSPNENRDSSPLSTMIMPGTQPSSLPNSQSSPSSSNEEYINGTMLNSMERLSTWPYNQPAMYGNYCKASPSTYYQPATVGMPTASNNSHRESQRNCLPPCLTVHPTPSKSRVETQIPIRLTLFPMPQGVTKLHLPTHTISKPKLLAKPTPEKSPDMLELSTVLVCTSAMQDPAKMRRAFTRAARAPSDVKKEEGRRLSSGDAPASEDEENKALNGGEVNICVGCITRERKRAARKKSKKPEEEEVWQKDEAKRIIVFNTTEVKDWQSPATHNQGPHAAGPTQHLMAGTYEEPVPLVPDGAMQVDAPMRIACYCRHQNEKVGFQVIFTIKDYQGSLVAQAMTNPIIITDDHKTQAVPPNPLGPMYVDNAHVPGGGIFTREPLENYGSTPFRATHSTPDLQRLQQSFNPQFATHTMSPFAVPYKSSQNTSTTLTPRNLSRQDSPSNAHSGPMHKKRKASGSGKLPDGLTMTKLQTNQGPSTSNPSWNSTLQSSGVRSGTASPFSPNFPPYNNSNEWMHGQPSASQPAPFSAGPPAQNTENNLFSMENRSQSMENLSTVQQMFSAPSSARQSRAASPVTAPQNGTNAHSGYGRTSVNSLYNLPNSLNPQRPPTIHKLIPNEGTKAGGIEVTCLGSGFCQGLEVMFGDSLATTTTYWGETSLVCLLPPAVHAGTVAVTFKHYYQQQMHSQRYPSPALPRQQAYFKYIDDDEQEILRHALALVHQKMTGRIEDAGEIARRIINAQPTGNGCWPSGSSHGGEQQRQVSALQACLAGSLDLEAGLLKCLDLIDLDDSPFQAQLNLQRANGQGMLHLSASLGFTRLVAGLLARGANPDLRDNNGMSPMHMAAINGQSQIIRRLRIAGADPSLRSLLGFTPADMTSSQEVLNAVKNLHHTRARSAGANSIKDLSRSSSTASLQSLWVPTLAGRSISLEGTLSDQSENSSEETDKSETNLRHGTAPAHLWARSRSTSAAIEPDMVADHVPGQIAAAAGLLSPAAAMTAWRDQLAAQIQHFQQSVNWTLPNLQIPTLPPMPNLPDYQDYPMVRRFSALVPQRNSRPGIPSTETHESKENDYRWWELLTGAASSLPSSPPPYEEIYPAEMQNALHLKKVSTARAVADTIVDRKCSATFDVPRAEKSNTLSSLRIGGEALTIKQQDQLRSEHARKIKRLRSDRNLFFIWIPLLVFIMLAVLKNRVPQVWNLSQEIYALVQRRYQEQIVEAP